MLGRDRRSAETALSNALTCIRELFEPETTANNLRLIREAREGRNEADGWALTLENELMKRVPPKG